jgi:hypothetical protein
VRDGKIIGMDDQELRIGKVAEALGDGLGFGGKIQCKEKREKARREQAVRKHGDAPELWTAAGP